MRFIARCRKYWWWVVIHETQEHLVKEANELHVRRGGLPNSNPPETAACFQPRDLWYFVPGDGGPMIPESKGGYVGTMRFVKNNCDTEIIVHESVHCACRIYRVMWSERVDLGMDCDQEEENLSYLIGEISQEMVNKFYELGLFPTTR